jgi:hypothetical protein
MYSHRSIDLIKHFWQSRTHNHHSKISSFSTYQQQTGPEGNQEKKIPFTIGARFFLAPLFERDFSRSWLLLKLTGANRG